MRVEPYGVDSYVHVMKRGSRGLAIVQDEADRWRFTRMLYHLNDEYKNDFWERETFGFKPFERPRTWPERKPLTQILAWTLSHNHFHLLLKEMREGGISKFMQKLCGSMTLHFNGKYDGKGSIFQGAYKSRTVSDDFYLQHLAPYIMVKNVFELYPKGYDVAVKEFDAAWKWGVEQYPFSSLPDYGSNRSSPILDRELLGELFESPTAFKAHSREMIRNRLVESRSDLWQASLEE